MKKSRSLHLFCCLLVPAIVSIFFVACSDSLNRGPFVPAAIGADVPATDSLSHAAWIYGGNVGANEIKVQYSFIDDKTLDLKIGIRTVATPAFLSYNNVTAAPYPARPESVNETSFGGLLPDSAYIVVMQAYRQSMLIDSVFDTVWTKAQ